MALWSVKPQLNKSLVERSFLTKGHDTIVVETGWRWGEFTVETSGDDPPKIAAGVDIYGCGYDGQLVETSDGCWEEINYDNCSDAAREWLREFFDDEDHTWLDLEAHGWVNSETEMFINCDLLIERLDHDSDGEIDGSGQQESEPGPKAKWPL